MKVKEIMNPVIKVSVNATVSDAAKLMSQQNFGSLLVEEHDKFVGIITERDILIKIVAEGRDPKIVSVREVQTDKIITVSPELSIAEANDIMLENKIRRLAVKQDGKIIGIFTIRDVSKSLGYSIGKNIRDKMTGISH